MGDLSAHFSRHEFACHCGCGFAEINMKLIDVLEKIRTETGKPIKINSGCRCVEYNNKIHGAANSAHTRGNAVDFEVTGDTMRFIVIRLVIKLIKRMGVYGTFIHIDVDEQNPAFVLWLGKEIK